jgi:hypothetical protein
MIVTFTPLEIPAGFNAPLGFESQRLEFLTGFTGMVE